MDLAGRGAFGSQAVEQIDIIRGFAGGGGPTHMY
jgi:hypothetical protein